MHIFPKAPALPETSQVVAMPVHRVVVVHSEAVAVLSDVILTLVAAVAHVVSPQLLALLQAMLQKVVL